VLETFNGLLYLPIRYDQVGCSYLYDIDDIWTLLEQEAFPSLLSLMHPSMEALPALSITGLKNYILSSLSFVRFHLDFLSLSLSLFCCLSCLISFVS
jgi:hypothetical protein